MDTTFLSPDLIVGEIKQVLEREYAVKLKASATREVILLAALAILKGQKPERAYPGLTEGAPDTATAASSNVFGTLNAEERSLVAFELPLCDGDIGDTLIAVQKRLLKPYYDQGKTTAFAVNALRPRFPNIFQ